MDGPATNEDLNAIRSAVREACGKYGSESSRKLDREPAYPDAFVREMPHPRRPASLIPLASAARRRGVAGAR